MRVMIISGNEILSRKEKLSPLFDQKEKKFAVGLCWRFGLILMKLCTGAYLGPKHEVSWKDRFM